MKRPAGWGEGYHPAAKHANLEAAPRTPPRRPGALRKTAPVGAAVPPAKVARTLASSFVTRIEDVVVGMIVEYDGGQQAYVENVYPPLGEMWLTDCESRQTVVDGSGGTRTFQMSELLFTGEWSEEVEATETMLVPRELCSRVVKGEFLEAWRVATGISLQLQGHVVAKPTPLPFKLLLGPAKRPALNDAATWLTRQVEDLLDELDLAEGQPPPATVDVEESPADEVELPAEDFPAERPAPVRVPAIRVPAAKAAEPEADKAADAVDAAVAPGADKEAEWRKGFEQAMRERAEKKLKKQAAKLSREQAEVARKARELEEERRKYAEKEKQVEEIQRKVAEELQKAQDLQKKSEEALSKKKAPMTISDWAKAQDQFADLPQLPKDWIRCKSSKGMMYYVNTKTGESTAREPTEKVEVTEDKEREEAKEEKTGDANGATEEKTGDANGAEQEEAAAAPAGGPLPAPWEEMTSRSSGRIYYFNSETGKSQFQRPT
eukprot:TRINITY_DN38100_c0_g2_i1.p1 TRINITY_DN38100_c0_g2~~TRINITY_DN38100_c0_g2_i1.p1  ORF type:complete len:492 (+),score=171.75 TRINITY_DN38100_c0_g2_i1:80-1555(+)